MKKTIWICVVVSVLLITPFIFVRRVRVPVLSTAETYNLSTNEIAQLIKKAVDDNNGEAAFRLWQYYHFSTTNRDEALKWLNVSANLSNSSAMYNLECFKKEKQIP